MVVHFKFPWMSADLHLQTVDYVHVSDGCSTSRQFCEEPQWQDLQTSSVERAIRLVRNSARASLDLTPGRAKQVASRFRDAGLNKDFVFECGVGTQSDVPYESLQRFVSFRSPRTTEQQRRGEQRRAIAGVAESGAIVTLLQTFPADSYQHRYMIFRSLAKHYHGPKIQLRVLVETRKQGWEGELQRLRVRLRDVAETVELIDVAAYFADSPAPEPDALSEPVVQSPTTCAAKAKTGYKKMITFWVDGLFEVPELQQFRFLWRLDSDAKLTSNVTSDIFQTMRQEDSVVGTYHLNIDYSDCCKHFGVLAKHRRPRFTHARPGRSLAHW